MIKGDGAPVGSSGNADSADKRVPLGWFKGEPYYERTPEIIAAIQSNPPRYL